MALHGCMRCMKYLVFAFNFFVWLAGMSVLGYAIWLRMDPKITNYVLAVYDNHINDYYIICYILMATGGVMTFVGFLGCCGAFQESKCMLGTFFVFLFLIFSMEIAGGVWSFINKNDIKSQGLNSFRTNIETKYGSGTVMDDAVDYVHKTLQCCGVDGPTDWEDSMFGQADITNLHRVPDSCCRVEPRAQNISEGLCGVGGAWRDKTHPAIWNKGCGTELVEFLQQYMIVMVITALAVGAVQFLGMSFSMMLCCAMRRSRGGGYKS